MGKPYQGVSPWRQGRHLLAGQWQVLAHPQAEVSGRPGAAGLPGCAPGVAFTGLSAPHPDPFLLFEKKGEKKANKGGDAPP